MIPEPLDPDHGASIWPDGYFRLLIGRFVVLVDRSGKPINDAERDKMRRELDRMTTRFPFTKKAPK